MRQNSMNFFKQILYSLLLSLPLFASTPALEKISLQLQWKHQFEFAGFYAAKEKGFYADVGLDVEFLEFSKDTDIVNIVLRGDAEYGLTYASIFAEYIKGKPLVLVANFFKQSPLVLVAQKDIQTPFDLKGKTVMGLSDNIDNITLLSMLRKFDINLEDIHTVPTTFSIDDFVNKNVDAMSVFTTNELYQLNQKGIEYNIFDPTVYGAKYYDVNLFTSHKERTLHPDRIKKFRDASIKGWKYALDHPDEIIEIILEKYNTQNRTREALRFEAQQIKHIMLPNVYPIGSVDIERVKIIVDSFLQEGFLEKVTTQDIDKLIYNDKYKSITLTDKELEFIKKHPKITLGTDRGWKPYVIIDDEYNISGYDNDVLSLINKITGSNFVLKVGKWGEMQTQAKNREIDGLSTGGIHKERKEYLNFSDIYITMQKMIITSKENPKNIYSKDDLKGKNIGIHSSNLVDVKIAESLTKSKIMRYDSVKEVINSVVTGETDAIFDNGSVLYLANELGMPYIKMVANLDHKLELAFGVRKDWPEAVSIINKGLKAIGKKNLLELKKKWFSMKYNYYTLIDIDYQPQELEYISKKNFINFCVDPNWMPFEAIQNHKYIGLASSYLSLFSKSLGKEFRLIETNSWQETLEKAKARECDILPLAAQTDSREKYMDFTTAYLSVPLVIVTKIGMPFMSSLDQILDKKLAVVKGYSFIENLKIRYPTINLVEVDSIQDALHGVERGELFGYLDNSYTINHAIQRDYIGLLTVSGQFEENIELSVATRNDEPLLHSIFQRLVNAIDSEKKENILNKWVTISYKKEIDYQLIWKILSFGFILFLIFLYRQYTMKKLNQELQIRVKEEVEKSREKDYFIFQQNKFVSMGEMVANIAHQWRQPISVVGAVVDYLILQSKSGILKEEELYNKLNIIETNVMQMSQTIEDFLSYFKPNKKKDQFLLHDAVDKALTIMDASITKNSIVALNNIENNIMLNGYKEEYIQVLITLMTNSIQAFKNQEYLGEKKINIETITYGKRIVLEIYDNAGGIEENILEKIFEPYFTTKQQSQGTGLGLYIAKMIIEKRMNGSLQVKNITNGVKFFIEIDIESLIQNTQ